MSFFHLPDDIFIRCQSYLSLFDILSFGFSCKIFHNIVIHSLDEITIESIKDIKMILNYCGDNSLSIKNIYFTKKYVYRGHSHAKMFKMFKMVLIKCKKEFIEYIEFPPRMVDDSLLSYYRCLNNLKKIILRGMVISNIDFLANLENLEYLSLEDDSFRKYGILDIKIIQNLKKLKYLDCSDNTSEYDRYVYSLELINNFSDLEYLNLTNVQPGEDDIDFLDLLKLNNLKNLRCIKLSNIVKNFEYIVILFPNLENITLTDCKSIVSFKHLKDLHNLKTLNLHGIVVEMMIMEDNDYDYNSIQYITQLETIHLSLNSTSNIVFMDRLTNLTDIDLATCNNINNLEPLRNLTKLKYLNLEECGSIQSIEPLKNLLNLQHLNISNYELLYHLIDLQILEITTEHPSINLISLKKLRIKCQKITFLEPLRYLVNIEYLDLTFCQKIISLEPLRNLINMKYLNLLHGHEIISLEPLSNLVNIEKLYLYDYNKITSLEPLKNLIKLIILNLTECSQIENLEPLQNLINLKKLILRRCFKILDYTPLCSLKTIDVIYTTRHESLDIISLLSQKLPNSYIY